VIDPGGASGKGITDFLKAGVVKVLGKLKLQISGTGITNYDRITNSIATGGFDITDAVLDVTGIYTPLVDRTFDIITTNASGTLTGNFSSSNVIGLTPGWSVAYTNSTGGKVQLVYSTANTWTGATSTNWATASNWSNGGVPISTSDVTIGTGTYQPVISSDVSVASLTLNASTSLTVSSGFNLTVTGAIANSGALTIESNANLIQGGTTNANTGNITVKRNSNALYRSDYTIWSSPVTQVRI
jgi:hypothetical protein